MPEFNPSIKSTVKLTVSMITYEVHDPLESSSVIPIMLQYGICTKIALLSALFNVRELPSQNCQSLHANLELMVLNYH